MKRVPLCRSFIFCFLCACAVLGTELAQAVVDAGAVPSLVLCLQEPELALKRIAASAISDIAKHSPEVTVFVAHAKDYHEKDYYYTVSICFVFLAGPGCGGWRDDSSLGSTHSQHRLQTQETSE